MPESSQPSVAAPVPSTLTDQKLDERWLETWLQQDPTRLGLGSTVRIVRAQIQHTRNGGRLDLQAVDDAVENRVYDIELMRGEMDADHGFRALDYWAREQRDDDDDRDHRPVIVAEKLRSSRYWPLLEVLSSRLGLIGIEVRCFVVGGQTAVLLDPVLLPDDLQADTSGNVREPSAAQTKEDWNARTTTEFQGFFAALHSVLADSGLKHRVVWSAKSYIGLWRGSRCWCPIWPRKDASGRIYLPCPADWSPGSNSTTPPEFLECQAALGSSGVDAVWAWSYNQGANPIAITLRKEHLQSAPLIELFQQTWKAMLSTP